MAAMTESQFFAYIASLFPNTPIHAHSGSQTNLMWQPSKDFLGNRLVHFLQASAGLAGPITGYKRVDCGLQTIELSYSSRPSRSGTNQGTVPRKTPTGGFAFNSTGGYSVRYWYIPRDSYSDSTWVNMITQFNAGIPIKLPPYAGKKLDINPVYLNDLSENLTPFYVPQRGRKADGPRRAFFI